jgi:sugar O-acyltransferase (sialic acid O-acetyltransferase NeuD family)
MQDLYLFPFNGNALEAFDCISEEYNVLAFIDDDPQKIGTMYQGIPVVDRTVLQKNKQVKVLAVPGSPTSFKVRKSIIDGLQINPDRFVTIIHPHASVSKYAKIGRNSLLMAGVVITSNAEIGDHVCILPNSVIHHDTKIGDYTLVSSNVSIAGYTSIEENCYIGMGVSIINGISIGKGSIIGLGSHVINSIPPNSKAVGNPAKLL